MRFNWFRKGQSTLKTLPLVFIPEPLPCFILSRRKSRTAPLVWFWSEDCEQNMRRVARRGLEHTHKVRKPNACWLLLCCPTSVLLSISFLLSRNRRGSRGTMTAGKWTLQEKEGQVWGVGPGENKWPRLVQPTAPQCQVLNSLLRGRT
jgi:hypothetical protein